MTTEAAVQVDVYTSGVVTAWRPRSRYGFIRSDAGRDVFVHETDVVSQEPLPRGTAVTFRTELRNGKLRAVNVTPVSRPAGSEPSHRRSGSILQWKPKGYGFILDEATGIEVYTHVSQLTPRRDPQLGARVRFDLAEDADGRRFAANVRVLDSDDPTGLSVLGTPRRVNRALGRF